MNKTTLLILLVVIPFSIIALVYHYSPVVIMEGGFRYHVTGKITYPADQGRHISELIVRLYPDLKGDSEIVWEKDVKIDEAGALDAVVTTGIVWGVKHNLWFSFLSEKRPAVFPLKKVELIDKKGGQLLAVISSSHIRQNAETIDIGELAIVR